VQRDHPRFRGLRDFLAFLTARGDLARIAAPVDVALDMTEVQRRVLRVGGPALRFDGPTVSGRSATMPVIANLFGTEERVAAGLGVRRERVGELGELLAALREPAPIDGLKDALSRWPMIRAALSTRPAIVASPPCQEVRHVGAAADLTALPVQTCWPGEPAPLITWPLVITRPPGGDWGDTGRYNLGVYRMQVAGRGSAILRWLAHRGGARHHAQWRKLGREMPVAVVIGADPATILSAVLPLPETVPELRFSGLLRGERPVLVPCVSVPLAVPAEAEIVIEGFVSPNETAPEGPYGDHTGYYNSVEPFPVMRVTAVTTRRAPLYLSTFTGRAPDEPSRIGEALNVLFLPLLQRQFPEVVDLWLPPEACSYRIAVVAIAKRYPGQARRLMLGLWSLLPQFSYTKLVIVVDDDIDPRDWAQVMWAVATRADASRDLVTLADTPIDYLDFASPKPGLGGKLGIDATNKLPPETEREWGRPMVMDPAVTARIDALWPSLGLAPGSEISR